MRYTQVGVLGGKVSEGRADVDWRGGLLDKVLAMQALEPDF